MKTLILAAGRGTRISRYLSGNPKCTVDIGEGKCLIQYTVDLLKSRGIRDIGIVLGYKSQVIRDVLEGREVSFFYNPFYDVTNSIASAWFARDFLEGDDLLIMNGDVYLEDRLLDRILAEKKSPVMFADESRKETADYKFFYEYGILKKYRSSGATRTGELLLPDNVMEIIGSFLKETSVKRDNILLPLTSLLKAAGKTLTSFYLDAS